MKKKCMKKKERKKEKVQKLIWATAQTMSRYNGKLYRDMALWMCSGLDNCIATWGSWVAGCLCRNTPSVL